MIKKPRFIQAIQTYLKQRKGRKYLKILKDDYKHYFHPCWDESEIASRRRNQYFHYKRKIKAKYGLV